ncbi:MAG TPA: chemotaxis protein CheB [Flavisolibacter sp.]|jgi:two-component system chemotaxis response regulator CheB|nr:chemotaxis protein CheB [Flavisolibacter sp.]
MHKRDIIVIGASAGGVQALMELIDALPEKLDAAVFIVLHISPSTPSMLPHILSRKGKFEAIHPKDGDTIKKGHVYIAPPDHHLILEKDTVLVRKGPKENRFRPSIDALFRSAAYTYSTRVIGIILSGMLDDGTSGLWTVKRLGGVSMIQDPHDARFPDMPKNALESVEVDYSVPIGEMGAIIERLITEKNETNTMASEPEQERIQAEITIAVQDNAFEMGIMNMGPLTPFTCPECHGTLVAIEEGRIVRFRCHTGHGFTASALLDGVTKVVEENLWAAVRGLEETVMLLEQTAGKLNAQGNSKDAKVFDKKAKETRNKSQGIRKLIFEQERMSEEKFESHE